MRDELQWSISHIHSKKSKLQSDRAPQELISAISTRIAQRPTRREEIVSGLAGEIPSKSNITFDEFVTDFERRGGESIDARAFWGKVRGSTFSIEIAAGLGAKRWWLPRMDGEVFERKQGGTLVRYQLRGIQPSQVLVTAIGLMISIAAICTGVVLLADGSAFPGAIFALAVGVAMLALLLWFVRTAARIATAMEQSLVRTLNLLAT